MKIRLIRKQAMPVPQPTPEERSRMLEEGIGVAPFDPRHKSPKDKLPNTTKTEIASLVEQAGGPLWNEMSEEDKKTVLQLPQIFKLDPELLVEIDGQNYYILNVVEPKDVKKVTVFDGVTYQKGQRYPGKIVALSATTGDPVEFPYEGTVENIKQPAEKKERIMAAMNKEIQAWNKRLQDIEKAAHISRIALQLVSAETQVENRIETVRDMISAISSKRDNPPSSPGYEGWANRVMQEVLSGQTSLVDAFHTLLWKYQNNPNALISAINDNSLQVPESLRQPLLNIAQREIENKRAKQEQERADMDAKETAINTEWPPEEGILEEPLPIVTPESIPGGDYKKLPAYGNIDNIREQPSQQLASLNSDLTSLLSVKSALESLRTFVGDLEKGQRSNAYLSSPEGAEVVSNVMTHLNSIKKFIKRYKTPPLEEGRINPKLFGTKGDNLGNALLAVALNKIGATIYAILKPHLETPSISPTTTTTPTEETVNAHKYHDLTKMSMDMSMWNNFLGKYLGKFK